MSVINQVLQDLDRRGVAVNVGEQTLASVPVPAPRWPWFAGALTLAIAATLVWVMRPTGSAPAAIPSAAVGVAAPVTASAPAPARTSATAKRAVTPAASAVTPVKAQAAAPLALAKTEPAKPVEPMAAPAPSQKVLAPAATPVSGKKMNTQNQADAEYARAVMLVEQGREDEAQSALTATLKLDNGHREARTLLARLLIQARRSNEAERLLQDGLNLHPDASADAMLLARLRVEHGEVAAALETLRAYAPHAQQKPDYRAFMGTLAQRLGRHNEAVTDYQAALQLVPANAAWWVGLGISLQAAGHEAEAKSAYQRALALGMLTPEMQRFAEQRLNGGQKRQGE